MRNKVTLQNKFVRIVITDADGKNISLTSSFSGERASASPGIPEFKEIARKFWAFMNAPSETATPTSKIKAFAVIVLASASFSDLLSRVSKVGA